MIQSRKSLLSSILRQSSSTKKAIVAFTNGTQQQQHIRTFSSAPTSSPTSFSHDKIATDDRYASNAEVPESLLTNDAEGEFSIRGKFKEGRAAYLDMSATTPLDPRVFDKMAPYMVSVRRIGSVLSFWFQVGLIILYVTQISLLAFLQKFSIYSISLEFTRLDPMVIHTVEHINMDGNPKKQLKLRVNKSHLSSMPLLKKSYSHQEPRNPTTLPSKVWLTFMETWTERTAK